MIAFTLFQEDRIGGEEHIHMIRMGCLCGPWGSPGGSKGVSLGVGVGSWGVTKWPVVSRGFLRLADSSSKGILGNSWGSLREF